MIYVVFEVFTAVVLKSIFFWDWIPLNALHGVISQKKILFMIYVYNITLDLKLLFLHKISFHIYVYTVRNVLQS
jgi:hypothetical protein